MKKNALSPAELTELCRGLALLLHAGVGLGDGLYLLAEDADNRKDLLCELGRQIDAGVSLSEAMTAVGLFPAYVTGMVQVGERTGRTEEALHALAAYYEEREALENRVRGALTYPAVLLLLMLVVVGVLLVKVLPVFDEVYASLGSRLTGFAGGLLRLGQLLEAAMPVLCVLLMAAAALIILFSVSEGFRRRTLALWRAGRGDRGVSAKLNHARFARALAMGLCSGLSAEEAVTLAAGLLEDVPAAAERCRVCGAKLAAGASLPQALRETGVLEPAACRLLELGLRSGSGDRVMEDIARRLAEEASEALERRTAQVEPAMVLAASVLVGAILLAVMLPLMHIMSAIG